MKKADVQEWLSNRVTEAYFAYLDQRIAKLKEMRGDGTLVNEDPQKMYRANWELVGALGELQAIKDLKIDDEQIYEVFGVADEIREEVGELRNYAGGAASAR